MLVQCILALHLYTVRTWLIYLRHGWGEVFIVDTRESTAKGIWKRAGRESGRANMAVREEEKERNKERRARRVNCLKIQCFRIGGGVRKAENSHKYWVSIEASMGFGMPVAPQLGSLFWTWHKWRDCLILWTILWSLVHCICVLRGI